MFESSRLEYEEKSESDIQRPLKKQYSSPKDMTPSFSRQEDVALENETPFIIESSPESMLMPWMSMLSPVLKGLVERS
jgi:hypothetical protein